MISFYDIISKVYFPKGDPWEEGFSVSCGLFQMAERGRLDLSPYKLVMNYTPTYGESTVLTCYKEALRQRGMTTVFTDRKDLQANDKAVVFDPWCRQLIERDYDIEVLQHMDYCNADIISIKSLRLRQ